MRDLVIIPTFSRPEMLWCCLEHLSRCKEISTLDIQVCADQHRTGRRTPLKDIEAVLRYCGMNIDFVLRAPHDYHGNSYNVMTAYKEAHGRRFVFMIEDDVMVTPDFFAWHYEQHKLDWFVSIGVENYRSQMLVSDKDFASLGICFPQSSIGWISEHCRHEYFVNLRGYMKTHFGVTDDYCEQDGLIMHLMRQLGGMSVWPKRAVAEHIGWYGYHAKGVRPVGSLLQRHEHVKHMILARAS